MIRKRVRSSRRKTKQNKTNLVVSDLIFSDILDKIAKGDSLVNMK